MIPKSLRKMRFAPKLMLSFIVLTALMTVFIWWMYYAVTGRMENMAVVSTQNAQRQLKEKLEQRIEEFRNLISYCRNDNGFVYLMNRKRYPDGETIYQMQKLQERLPNISIANGDVMGYYYYSSLNGFILSNVRLSMRVDMYYDDTLELEGLDYSDWKKLMDAPRTGATLLKAQKVTWDGVSARCVPCLLPIQNDRMDQMGCAVFFLRESAIQNLFGTSVDTRTGYMCLRNGAGDIVTVRIQAPGKTEAGILRWKARQMMAFSASQ